MGRGTKVPGYGAGALILITDSINSDRHFTGQGLPANTRCSYHLGHARMGKDRRKANLDPLRESGCSTDGHVPGTRLSPYHGVHLVESH